MVRVIKLTKRLYGTVFFCDVKTIWYYCARRRQISIKNVAAVAVNAELPAFAKPGQNIDVTVSSLANAKSLRGGTLY